MKFPLFTIFVLFIVFFTISRTREAKHRKDDQKKFWNKEEAANATRRKDISNLPYIAIPLADLPFGKVKDDPVVTECEEQLMALSQQKILNLTGITNTELKLAYGVPNLPQLSQYDQNFTILVQRLNKWSHRLYELGYLSEACAILEFAVHSGSDIKGSYQLLIQIYLDTGVPEKILPLKEYAKQLNSMMKDAILVLLDLY